MQVDMVAIQAANLNCGLSSYYEMRRQAHLASSPQELLVLYLFLTNGALLVLLQPSRDTF